MSKRKPETTLQDQLRAVVRAAMKQCPTCGRRLPGGLRRVGKVIGLGAATLSRWLRGTDMTGRNLDKVFAYAQRQQEAKHAE